MLEKPSRLCRRSYADGLRLFIFLIVPVKREDLQLAASRKYRGTSERRGLLSLIEEGQWSATFEARSMRWRVTGVRDDDRGVFLAYDQTRTVVDAGQLREGAKRAVTTLAPVRASAPPFSFGTYYKSRTLHLAVMEIKRAPEVRYATIDPNDVIRHYRLIPAEEDHELVLVRLKVQNHTFTNSIFTVDEQGAVLRDFSGTTA